MDNEPVKEIFQNNQIKQQLNILSNDWKRTSNPLIFSVMTRSNDDRCLLVRMVSVGINK